MSLNSSGLIVLTVAFVPTGINIGVSKDPCGVCTIPNLAPDCLHVLYAHMSLQAYVKPHILLYN